MNFVAGALLLARLSIDSPNVDAQKASLGTHKAQESVNKQYLYTLL